MIEIKDKKDCCGCHACATVCAKHCITMKSDEEGFLYPVVDKDTCTDCGLCEKVCPVINQSEPRKPLKVYAAKNKNEEIRRQSSSGGIFTLLAEKVIAEGGVVFGARFDENWDVIHSWTDTIEGIAAFRGSKYVQSTIGDTYREAKDFLKQDRKVLFSGTPCQIAGLNYYLGKSYDQLLTVEVACHGVPSPMVWRNYLYIKAKGRSVQNVSFRDKSTGYYTYSTNYTINGRTYKQYYKYDDYMLGFIHNLYLRPSCFNCPSKGGRSGADLLIADNWAGQGINDKKGSTLLLCYSEHTRLFFSSELFQIPVDYNIAILKNPSIVSCVNESVEAKEFWRKYIETKDYRLCKYTKQYKENVIQRVIKKFYYVIKKICS